MTDNLTPVTGSSQMEAWGYDPAARVFTVKFRSGSTYRYKDVPAEVHEKLLAAHKDSRRSLGKEFHVLVVKGGFEFEKL